MLTNNLEYISKKHSLPLTLLDGKNVYCENGQALSIYGDFCHECQECPTFEIFTEMGLTSNCSKISNHFCPMFLGSSKICMDKVNVNITDYCSASYVRKPWFCPKAINGLNFEQCYLE